MTIIELCCGTVDEVVLAAKHGIKRIELCQGLACGGLTPSQSMVERALELNLETIAMVRSCEGGFCYSNDEFETMKSDAKNLIAMGVDGIVFGFCTADGKLDADRMKALKEIAGNKTTMIHRASDVPDSLEDTVEQLIGIGIDRVLTSGKGGSADKGSARLKSLKAAFGTQIQIVAGGGIRPENVRSLIEGTSVPVVHFAARKNIDTPGYAGVADPTPDEETIVEMVKLLS